MLAPCEILLPSWLVCLERAWKGATVWQLVELTAVHVPAYAGDPE